MSYGEGMNLTEVIDDFVDHGFPVEKLIGGVMTERPYPARTDSLGPEGRGCQEATIGWSDGLTNRQRLYPRVGRSSSRRGGSQLQGSSSALGGS